MHAAQWYFEYYQRLPTMVPVLISLFAFTLTTLRFIESFSSMKCFFSLRMGVEVASIYKFFVSQHVSVANVRMMPIDYAISFDLPSRDVCDLIAEFVLSSNR
jgi:hypothetical protein